MARTIDAIQQQIIDNASLQPELAPLVANTSRRSIWRLWTYIVAVGISILEQLMDVFKSDVESTVSKAIPNTPLWLQEKVFEFQYDATTPQIIQLVNLVPQYPTIDTTKRIITRCSVKTDLSNNVKIKVAKGAVPGALASLELSALQSYIDTIGIPGVTYLAISQSADNLYIDADIYYQGQYSSVIQANVIAAINNYLASLPFDGTLKLSDLENTIRNVAGVNDVVLKNVRARQDSDPFASGTDIILNNQVLARLWNTVGGYVIAETTTGKTLNDSLTFIAE